MKKSILIVGCNGQDGRVLAEVLKNKYNIYGFVRKNNTYNNLIKKNTFINKGTNHKSISKILTQKKIIKIFYFAGDSYVNPNKILDQKYINEHFQILNNYMKAIINSNKNIIFIYANSSEVFGDPVETPQNEETPHNPVNVYGFTRSLMHKILIYYRANFRLNLINIYYYNHESKYRNKKFFTKKIIDYAKSNHKKKLEVGSLSHKRDMGSAKQYMEITYKLSKKVKKGDFIIASGKQTSYEEIVNQIFTRYNLNKKKLLKFNKKFDRNIHSSKLVGDNSKIKNLLNIKHFIEVKDEIEGILNYLDNN